MIKECNIISYNKSLQIVVFEFDKRLIQTTADIIDDTKSIYVKFDKGKFNIVSKEEYEKSTRKKLVSKTYSEKRT